MDAAAKEKLCQDARTKLCELGTTDKEIAAKLKEKNITGVPEEPTDCPLYHFLEAELRDQFEEKTTIRVRGTTVVVGDCQLYTPSFAKKLAAQGNVIPDDHIIPEAIHNFVHNFDEREYPDLIDPNWDDTRDEEYEDEEYEDDDE
jgi:hypothetical protein